MGITKIKEGMRFRDIESFNKALLAKQWGRLLKEPQSLAARIYKKRYFKDGLFWNAKLGNSPSLIWRSIWSVMELLKKGLVWRVGNGQTIEIWGQKWMPTPSYRVQVPIRVLEAYAKVCELIDAKTRRWK